MFQAQLPTKIYRYTKSFIKNPIFKLELITRILFEKIIGIETYKQVSIENLNIPLELEPVHYESSGNSYLGKVLKSQGINSNDSIIDFGCGKGGAVLYMNKFPFKKIVGVEYSKSIFDQAKRNINKCKRSNITIVNKDAQEYKDIDNFNYIYFYNPFGKSVFINVLENIEHSIKQNPRSIKIIYKNPIHHEIIEEKGLFKMTGEYETEYNNKFHVYNYSL